MLDPITQGQIWHVLLDHVRSRGLGVLAVCHDDPLLHAVADRVIDLPDGAAGPGPRVTAGLRR